MPADPRCPNCGEKVSATARWCMHCSAEFDEPVDRSGGGNGRGREVTVSADRDASGEAPGAADREFGFDAGSVRSDTGSVRSDTGSVVTDTGTVQTDTGSTGGADDPVAAGTDRTAAAGGTVEGADPVDHWRPDADSTGTVGGHSALASLVAFLGASERRRQLLVLAIALAVWATQGVVAPSFPAVGFLGGLLLGLYLFTRDDAAATLAAGLTGAGVALVGFGALVARGFGLEAVLSLDPGVLAGVLPVMVVGVALAATGRWVGNRRL